MNIARGLTADRLPYPPPYQDLATLAQHISTGELRWGSCLGQGPQAH